MGTVLTTTDLVYIIDIYHRNQEQPMSEPAEVAKIFMSGRSQAVRLPKSCRFDAAEVNARRVGRSVVLTPRHDDWEAAVRALFAAFEPQGDSGELKRPTEWRDKRRETLR